MTRSSESTKDRILTKYEGSWIRGTIRQTIDLVTPFNEMETIRSHFLYIFRSYYNSLPSVQDSLSGMDNPTLAERAKEESDNARQYDPLETVENYLNLFKEIQKVFLAVFAVLTLLTFWIGWWIHPLLNEMFSIFSAPLSFLPTVVLAFIWVYLAMLRWNRDALQIFNNNLVIKKGRISRKSRERDKIVSYYVWNQVIQGQTIPTLVSLLYLADQTSNLPIIRRFVDNPGRFILRTIGDYPGDFYHMDSAWGIAKKLYPEVRERIR